MVFKGSTYNPWIHRETWRESDIILCCPVDEFSMEDKMKKFLKELIYKLVQKMKSLSEDHITRIFHGMDIYHTDFYVKIHYVT